MKNSKAIFRLDVDFDRQGFLNGIFIERKDFVDYLLNNDIEIFFGEILGKHSEVTVSFFKGEGSIELVTDDINAVSIFEQYNMATGVNPFEYVLTKIPDEDTDIFFDDFRSYIEYKLKDVKYTEDFTLKQLFSLVDGRLTSDGYDEITKMITHICNCGLMSYQLAIAMNYIIEKNPIWLQGVTALINSIKSRLDTDEFEVLMEEIDNNYNNHVFSIPQLKDEFDTSDFEDYLIRNNPQLDK